jgi:hypothetical protein
MSTLRVNTIQNSGGTGSPAISGLAAAWVNFNGTGTVAIRASSNVSSITDNSTGDYTVNFTTALVDANYSTVATNGYLTGAGTVWGFLTEWSGKSTTSTTIKIANAALSSLVDSESVNIAIFR